MIRATSEKWVVVGAPAGAVADVAVETLGGRLAAVGFHLPLAAERADEDSEHVHQLRVWARRAGAALELYAELLPRRRYRWMKKQLKRVRRAANDARDCDVLLERLAKKENDHDRRRWQEEAQAKRARAQKAIVAVHDRLAHERFARRIDKLLARVGARQRDQELPCFRDWAHQRLRPLVKRFFRAVPADRADDKALHQLRIRGKELRYAIELVAPAFPGALRADLYPALEALQDRLGAINDLVTARDHLRQQMEEEPEEDWGRLLADEQADLDQAVRQFWQEYPPGALRELREGFEAVLREAPAGRVDPPPRPLPLPDGKGAPKARIVDELGERELLLPALVNEALAANDRAKYRMTLLQSARAHADQPDLPAGDLEQERLACGIEEPDLDSVVERSRKEGDDQYRIPAAARIHDRLVEDIRHMLAPLGAGTEHERRLRALLEQAPAVAGDHISGACIRALTSGQREAGDSLHLLVMDLHRELNRLQQELATESINGALVYGLGGDDRPLVAAFMAGVNRTRELKFDHPGLGTTATRAGRRLVIQNDIGLTEAHVLVIHVEGRRVTLTYTDVHIERLVFFQNLFERFGVRWQDTVSRRTPGRSEELYHLCLGTYEAASDNDVRGYLEFLGSRLVFLIDWNRARKRLRKFAPRRICLEVLRWAADHDVGHMGFLCLGGEQLIFDALQTAGRLPLLPGRQLSDLLGRERTAQFLEFTLQTASEGLRAGQSEFLLADQVSAELRHYIDTAHQRFLEQAAEHATLVVELAGAARDVLLAVGPEPDRERIGRLVQRARDWEHRADEVVKRCRAAQARDDSPVVLQLLLGADNIADGLEEAIFRMSLLAGGAGSTAGPLSDLAGLVLQGAQEYLKAVENARVLHRASTREQVADFLQAVDRIITVEHQTDDAHRRAQAGILGFTGDYRQWVVISGVADRLEEAADALMRSVLVLRDHVLGVVLRR